MTIARQHIIEHMALHPTAFAEKAAQLYAWARMLDHDDPARATCIEVAQLMRQASEEFSTMLASRDEVMAIRRAAA